MRRAADAEKATGAPCAAVDQDRGKTDQKCVPKMRPRARQFKTVKPISYTPGWSVGRRREDLSPGKSQSIFDGF
jgi:hypothetical protein